MRQLGRDDLGHVKWGWKAAPQRLQVMDAKESTLGWERESGKGTLSTTAYVAWIVLLTVVAILLISYKFGLLVVVVWFVQITRMWRRGQREQATIIEAQRLLAESRTADADRRTVLLNRFAADLQIVRNRLSAPSDENRS
jgi:hypothetical protein